MDFMLAKLYHNRFIPVKDNDDASRYFDAAGGADAGLGVTNVPSAVNKAAAAVESCLAVAASH